MLGCASREAANMRAMPWSGTQASVWQETVQIGGKKREGGTRDMKLTTKLHLDLVFLTDKYWAICWRKDLFWKISPLQLTKWSFADLESGAQFTLTVYSLLSWSYISLSPPQCYIHKLRRVADIPFYFVKNQQATEASAREEACRRRSLISAAPWYENDWEARTWETLSARKVQEFVNYTLSHLKIWRDELCKDGGERAGYWGWRRSFTLGANSFPSHLRLLPVSRS